MRLQLKNIGKINNIDISIDGITVLTGDNDTGKSTVGKVLYCLFSVFHNADDRVIKEKKGELSSFIYSEARNAFEGPVQLRKTYGSIRRQIFDVVSRKVSFENTDDQEFRNLVKKIFNSNNLILSDKNLDNMCDRYRIIASLETSEVLGQILKNQFQQEFGTSDIGTLNCSSMSEIDLTIKNKAIEISKKVGSRDFRVVDYIDLIKNVIYLDDPFVLDNLDNAVYYYNDSNHRNSLLGMLSAKSEKANAIGEIVTQKKLQKISAMLDKVCDGELRVSEIGEYQYYSDSIKGTIPIKEVSTGIKSFLVLKQLLMTGQLEENGIVILDEPEVHLHPQWQIIYAELIVLLQQSFNVNFVITTHSIDFLSALEYYSLKYSIDEKCHYYLMESMKSDGPTEGIETSGHLDQAYAKLSRPFLKLTNELEDERESG